MKLGIVANEFPPETGGMQEHALGIANTLATYYDVCVFTSDRHADHRYSLPYTVKPILARNRRDLLLLSSQDIDIFLVLNAGYAVLSKHTNKAVFCYCHGNDYLNPWIQTASPIVYDAILSLKKTPYFWRFSDPLRLKMNQRQVRKGLANAAAIFVNSTYTANRITREYPNVSCPLDVAYPGANEYFFSNPVIQPSPDSNWRFITVARLTRVARKKNVDNVLRALACLKSELCFHYTIIGDGDLRPQFEQLAYELDVSDHVSFIGDIPNKAVLKYLDNSDLFILPSKASSGDVESFGIVYVEAAARGVPSLASREGGAVDAISNMETGVIIEKSDPEGITQGIQTFVKNATAFDPGTVRAWAEQFRWHKTSAVIRDRIDALNV